MENYGEDTAPGGETQMTQAKKELQKSHRFPKIRKVAEIQIYLENSTI